MSPYLIAAAAVTIAAGVGYGTGAFGVPVTYGLAFLATLIGGAGYVRWDERQHQHDDR